MLHISNVCLWQLIGFGSSTVTHRDCYALVTTQPHFSFAAAALWPIFRSGDGEYTVEYNSKVTAAGIKTNFCFGHKPHWSKPKEAHE